VNCLDCQNSSPHDAVGVCILCGAAVCAEHAAIKSERLSCTRALGRVVVIERPVRQLLCKTCAQAHHEHAKCCPPTTAALSLS
jgi:hypothetical protein